MLRPLLLILAWWMALVAPVSQAHAEEPEARSTSVYVGVYLRDISRFALEEGRFEADLDAWMKWSGDAEPPPLRFINGELDTKEVVERESDGDWNSVRWHVQGTFRGQFDLHDFPYDRQPVEILVELPSAEQQSAEGRVFRLMPDAAASGMAAAFSLTGWQYEQAFTVRELETRLASDLGSIRHEGMPTVGQAVAFRVLMARPFTSYIIKFLLPLSIIVIVSMTVFWVEDEVLEVRASIGVTGVLSCIAFHFTQADTLPDVGYLVRADRLFLLAYLIVALALVETLVVHWFASKRPVLAHNLDRLSRLLFPVGFLSAAFIILRPPVEVPLTVPEIAEVSRPEHNSYDDSVMIYANGALETQLEALTWRYAGLRYGNDGLDTGEPPLLLEAVPSVTNELVRFTPEGGMEVTWRLRAGLRWSDGHPMDAGDLRLTLKSLPGAEAARFVDIDGRTVRAIWPDRKAVHLSDFRLLPEHAVADAVAAGRESLEDALDSAETPSCGPFVFAEARDDGSGVFRPNPHFAGSPPRLAELQVCFGRSAGCYDPTKLAYWHAMSSGSLTDVLEANGGVRPMTAYRGFRPKQYFFHLVIGGLPELATAESRRLLLGAIDRQALSDAEPSAVISDSFVDARGLSEPAPHDPDAARGLLSRFTPRRPLPVICRDIAGGIDPVVCRVVADSLRAAGATVEVTRIDNDARQRLAMEGGLSGLLVYQYGQVAQGLVPVGWAIPRLADVPDYSRSFSPAWSARQRGLAEVMQGSLYRERRDAAVAELGRQYAEELPTIPLMRAKAVAAADARLRGLVLEGGELYGNVEDWYTISPAQLAQETNHTLPATMQLTR